MTARSGVLLVNLGTPNSSHPKDVHRYLTEFLTDGRVIDLPWLQRQFLVRGIIIPGRYKQSAECYKKIWTSEGSPLLRYGVILKELLQKKLGETFKVELAMRYQQPSIKQALSNLNKQALEELIVFPLFPQYASATTGSVHQKIMEELKNHFHIPKMTFVNNFATDPEFITAFAAIGNTFSIDNYDHILFSFHGLPQRQLKKIDRGNYCLKQNNACCLTLTSKNHFCYSAQCYATANEIAKKLNLATEKYSLSFQSRLGKEPWLEPSTIDQIKKLAQKGLRNVLVFCPSFVCDCLETLYEIGIEYKHEFKLYGGNHLDLVPGLNDHPLWIDALRKMVLNASLFNSIILAIFIHYVFK